jgi:hypothetical protein
VRRSTETRNRATGLCYSICWQASEKAAHSTQFQVASVSVMYLTSVRPIDAVPFDTAADRQFHHYYLRHFDLRESMHAVVSKIFQ